VDLLSAREFIRYSRDPGLLREEVESARPRFVVIDEVQKVPALLDEVRRSDLGSDAGRQHGARSE
jgi:hypothetical protein